MKKIKMGGVEIGLSDKSDGNMKVLLDEASDGVVENRRKFLEGLGLVIDTVDFVKVDYETEDFCQFAEADETNGLRFDRQARRCDGLVVRERGRGLFLPLADCLGVVLFDTSKEVLMMVHCGRQTIVQGGAFKAIEFMKQVAGTIPSDVLVWMSPSAGKENYPIYALNGAGLQEEVVTQLRRAGVPEESIMKSAIDTIKDENYWSYSQGDTSDRFAIAAVMV